MQRQYSFFHFKYIRFLFIFLLIASCTEVRLIGAYDGKIDDGIQAVTKQVSSLFVKLDQTIDKGENIPYQDFEDYYLDIKTEVRTLRIRADGLPKYEIIKKQLALLDASITDLYKDHKTGFVATGITDTSVLKKAIRIDFSGIELSLSAMLKLQEGLKRTKADKPEKTKK